MSTSKDLSAYVARLEAKAIAKPAKATALEAKLDAKIASLIAKGKTVVIDGVTVTSYNLDTGGSSGGGSSGGGSSTSGSTYELTIASNTVSGTANNDSIDAPYQFTSIQTLNSSDTINGSGGTDTLFAQINTGVTPRLTSVETVQLNVTTAATVDMSEASGVTTLTSLASTANLTLSNVEELFKTVQALNTATANLTIAFEDSVLSGSADDITLDLTGVSGNTTIQLGSEIDTDGDIETVTITGTNSDLGTGSVVMADVTAVTVKATGSLDLGSTAAFTSATTFNASGSTGGVTVVLANRGAATSTVDRTITGGTGNDDFDISNFTDANVDDVSVSAGAGNDTIRIGTFDVSDMTIVGGDGTDTIVAGSASIANGTFSGFERYEVAMTANTTQDLDEIGGADIVRTRITGDDTVADVLTLQSVRSGHLVLVDATYDGEVDLQFENAGVNTATIQFEDSGHTIADIKSSTARMSSVTITNSTGGTGTVTDILAASNTGLLQINLTGTSAITITNAIANSVTLVDAAAGSGAYTVALGTGGDVYLGGSGVDAVTGNTGDDSVLGGAGNDTFTMTTGANDGTAGDTIWGGAGQDAITLDNDDTDDVVGFSETTDGAAAVTIASITGTTSDFTVANTNRDTVANFGAGGSTDRIAISGALNAAIDAIGTDDTVVDLADNGVIDWSTGGVFVFHEDDDLAGDDFGDISAIADVWNTINSGTPTNFSAGDEVLFAIGNNSDNATGLYYLKDVDGNGDISVGDIIALIAVLDTDVANIAAANFTFSL